MASLATKLEILGASCAFDISAPQYEIRKNQFSSGRIGTDLNAGSSSRERIINETAESCIYPAVTGCGVTGGVTPIFKALLSNACANSCKYCFTYCEKRKVTFTPEEYARVFEQLYQQKRVTGVFISSGILRGDPDYTTAQMLEAVRIIRERYNFNGYVHFKCIPGVRRELLQQAIPLANRISVNLEAPSAERLALIASEKDFRHDLITRQEWIGDMISKGAFPSGQTTQFVVGAADESDEEILSQVTWEYEHVRLRRAYFSAFSPLVGTPLENHPATSPIREHRLYMADFLLRQYHIPYKEFRDIFTNKGLLPEGDPKVHLARNFFDQHESVDINEAPFDQLIRVPGIGLKSAQKIIQLRELHHSLINARQLNEIGVRVQTALPFISLNGYHQRSLDRYFHFA